MVTAFFARQRPDSTVANPRFMKNTSMPAINVHIVSIATLAPPICSNNPWVNCAGAAPGSSFFASAAGAAGDAAGASIFAGSPAGGGSCACAALAAIKTPNATVSDASVKNFPACFILVSLLGNELT